MAHNLKWIEKPADVGLTLVGFADEISASIRHQGWFTNEAYDGTLRGVVYALPNRRGYVAGYADPVNTGAARLELSIIDGDTQAARTADRIAEIEAEEERNYQEGWQALVAASDKANEARDEVKGQLAVLRASRSMIAQGEIADDSETVQTAASVLNKAAKACGAFDLYVGDDGQVWGS